MTSKLLLFPYPQTSVFKTCLVNSYFQYFSIAALAIKQFPLDSSGLRFAYENSAGVPHEAFQNCAHDE